MKVLGKVCERLEGKDFELYLVDDIACSDEYVQIFEKNTIGRVPRLNKTIYTDGKTEIVSKRNVVEGKLHGLKLKLPSMSSSPFL